MFCSFSNGQEFISLLYNEDICFVSFLCSCMGVCENICYFLVSATARYSLPFFFSENELTFLRKAQGFTSFKIQEFLQSKIQQLFVIVVLISSLSMTQNKIDN